MSVVIRPVASRSEREKFIKLQWKFYRNEPNWVPPLLYDRRKVLDTKKNPFYQHAAIQLFIAYKDGEAVGRIAAIRNDNHNIEHDDKIGFFGFFECIDDQSVADALFIAASDWVKAQGLDVLRGPVNPSTNDDIGLLIDGFEYPPTFLMVYNPRYYQRLIEAHGFVKTKDMYAYLLRAEQVLTPKLERGQAIVRERYGVTVRDFDFKRLEEEAALVRDIYNKAWEKNWGAVAMTDAEFNTLAKDMVQVVSNHKRLVFFAERNGEAVGFALSLPDLNELLIHNKRGWLIPGALRMLTGSKKISLARILVLGILPEHRGKGIDSVLYYETLRRAGSYGIHRGEASWVLEDNVMMNRGAKLMNAELYKTYRVFDKALG